MYRMDKLTTGIAYGTSAGNAGFWMLQLLDKVSPSQWAAIGVLGSLVFGLLTLKKTGEELCEVNNVSDTT